MHGQQQPQMHNGFCVNMVDSSAFLNNPIQENQAIPHPPMSQWFQQNQSQAMYRDAVGKMRARLQERSNRSPLHIWTWNFISQNYFNNQAWQEWCITLFNFLELLTVAQSQYNPPQVAVDRASDTIYKCILVTMCDTQGFQQVVAQDPAMVADMQKYRAMLPTIRADIQAYRQGTYRPGGQPQQQQYGVQPNYGVQQNTANYGVPSNGGNANYGVQANNPVGGYVEKPTTAAISYGLGKPASDPTPATLNPVESYGAIIKPVEPPAQRQVYENMAPNGGNTQQYELSDLPVPSSASQVVLDPKYYLPAGKAVDIMRPFDTIYSPGGIITRPAYQVPSWKVTRNDKHVYTELLDPGKYVRFYTKFPDGLIEEIIVEYTEDMNYLQHETNPQLREAFEKAHSKGKPQVIYAQTPISTHMKDMQTIEEVVKLEVAGSDKPVKMVDEFQSSTEMETEQLAAVELRSRLGLARDAVLPVHEYYSTRLHVLDIDRPTFDALKELNELGDLIQISKELLRMKDQGSLPLRVFNFIDLRFTKDINNYLEQALSIDTKMDSFCLDIGELFNYFNTTPALGKNYSNLLMQATPALVGFNLNMSEDVIQDGEGTTVQEIFGISHRYTNLQTGWTLAQLTDRPAIGEANLVSRFSHEALIEAVHGMFTRATDNDRVRNRFRVITLDGAYLEMFRGALVAKSFMFKRTI